MLLDKLRISTKATHEALEQSMFPFIKNVHNVASYVKLLHLFYGYYKPLQDVIDLQIDEKEFPNYSQSRKVEWILEDLKALGEPAIDIPLCKLNFSIASHASAMGALYVTEGSTLGGKIICKTIAGNLSIAGTDGLKFFNGYGNETGSKWKTFLSILDIYSNTENEAAVIESANSVFSGFKQWIA